MDFVFDELANGRRVKTLTVLDDCSKEAVQSADRRGYVDSGVRDVGRGVLAEISKATKK